MLIDGFPDCINNYIFILLCFSAEIEKCGGDELRKDGDMKKYLDIISNKNIKLSERVLIPVQQYPKVRDTPGTSSPPKTHHTSSGSCVFK